MAKIVIKDLTESVDLDRQAMLAISGGARISRQGIATQAIARSTRILDYPPGFTRNPLTGKKAASK